MTDNEIIKALECCVTGRCSTGECAYYNRHDVADCIEQSTLDTLDLINRQKADIKSLKQISEEQQSVSMNRYFEIERLKEDIEAYKRDYAKRLEDLEKEEYEARKQFAEEVKQALERYGATEDCLVIVYNLVKKRVCEDSSTLVDKKK